MNIQVPTDINDITLEQYQKFALINTDDQDPEFFLMKQIEIFCGVDIQLVNQMRYEDIKDIADEISGVLAQESKFTNRFEMDGVEYGFIPDLQAISLGEFVDLEESLANVKDFHKAAAVMFRPIKKRFKELYTIEGYSASLESQAAFKQAPIGVISAAVVFFYDIVKELLQGSQDFLNKEIAKEMAILEQSNSLQSGDGSTLYTLFAGALQRTTTK